MWLVCAVPARPAPASVAAPLAAIDADVERARREFEIPGVAVVTKQQRAERPAGRTRFGPSTDNKFLFVQNFQLAPVVGPFPGVIDRVDAFGD